VAIAKEKSSPEPINGQLEAYFNARLAQDNASRLQKTPINTSAEFVEWIRKARENP
jgi:hypothetical protein